MKIIKIYTDGACRGNPGPGGWGALILKDKLDKKTLSDLKNSTTQLIEEFKKNQSTFIRDKNRNI